ncbi:hypothetical protein R1sor_010351 [Riccia sorocarpa]|uniref:Uncharacterized protein n=1 Tax=Riccia sorocarpa TaxID=122646 RepID=A0ABD3I1P1_9MARC
MRTSFLAYGYTRGLANFHVGPRDAAGTELFLTDEIKASWDAAWVEQNAAFESECDEHPELFGWMKDRMLACWDGNHQKFCWDLVANKYPTTIKYHPRVECIILDHSVEDVVEITQAMHSRNAQGFPFLRGSKKDLGTLPESWFDLDKWNRRTPRTQSPKNVSISVSYPVANDFRPNKTNQDGDQSESASTAAAASEPADIGLADPGPDIHIENPSEPDSKDDGTSTAPKKKHKLPTVVLTDGAMVHAQMKLPNPVLRPFVASDFESTQKFMVAEESKMKKNPSHKRRFPPIVESLATLCSKKDIISTSWGAKKIRSKAPSGISSDEESIPNCPFIDDEAEEVTDDESTGSSVLSSDGSFENFELEVESP